MDTITSTTHADLRSPSRASGRRTHAAAPGALPGAMFAAELLWRGLVHISHDEFSGSSPAASLAAVGRPVVVRADPSGDVVEALLRTDDDELVLVDAGYGHVCIEVAAATRAGADAVVTRLRGALAAEPPAPERVSVAFWMQGREGARVRHREIDAPRFEAVRDNYSAAVRDALEHLIAIHRPGRCGLILWRGAPGTGKSHALRALAREWAPWCSAHFIMDPQDLFAHGGAYMLDVLSWDGDGEDRWRLLILEDAGELIAADARAVTGQALSRLLNVADGVLGQGTRTLVLITTNEPLGRLHPATRRPGRCIADIEFVELGVAEANAWLAARAMARRVTRPTSLAELFVADDEEPVLQAGPADPLHEFGFARAMAQEPAEARSGESHRG